jgi:hypothetical protein
VRPSPAVTIATLALIVALGGVAHSAIPGPDGQIHACHFTDPDPSFSYVYLVDHDVACQGGEERITWAKSGGADQAILAAALQELNLGQQHLAALSASIDASRKRTDALVDKAKSVFSSKELKVFESKQRGVLEDVEKLAGATSKSAKSLDDVSADLQRIAESYHASAAQVIDSLK